jgi:hypothetical protein
MRWGHRALGGDLDVSRKRSQGGALAILACAALAGAPRAIAAPQACTTPTVTLESTAEMSAVATFGDEANWVLVRTGQVAYRRWRPGPGWGTEVSLAQGASYDTPVVVALESGVIRAAWIELDAAGNSEVRIQTIVDGVPSGSPVTVGPTAGQDRQLSAAPDGSDLWLTWISETAGSAKVYLARMEEGGLVHPPVEVSDTASNDWAPSVAVAEGGTAHVVWDSYVADDYDVFYRSYSTTTGLGPLRAIATGPAFQAHASATADETGRIWIAWEEAQAAWGKGELGNWQDWTLAEASANGLRTNRALRLAIFDPSTALLSTPSVDLDTHLTSYFIGTGGSSYPQHDMPTLVRRGGKTWVLFRYAVGHKAPARWDVYVTAVDDTTWHSVMTPCTTSGYLYQQSSISSATTAVWIAGGRTGDGSAGRVFASQFSGLTLAATTPITWTAGALPAVPAPQARAHATNSIVVDGTTYTTRWGDLHRHTEISTDDRWGNDGTVEELYRYAMDVAKLDFTAQTDHEYSYMARHYNRMFLQADLHLSSRFTPMYGYEWTARKTGPVSHHNVISRVRHAYPAPPNPSQDEIQDITGLFATLVPGVSITIPHTPAIDDKDDLQDWALLKQLGLVHPSFERLVEIYQGSRTSCEDVGAPAPFGESTSTLAAAGTIRTMLEEDARLGFIASSDHRSTFLSFAVAYAESTGRDSIFDALFARRTYATSSRDLILEFSVAGRPMGEEILIDGPGADVVTRAEVGGLGGTVEFVDIMRDGVVWQTVSPQAGSFTGTWTDPDVCGHSYYVRVRFSDSGRAGHMGWSSPVWVACNPPPPIPGLVETATFSTKTTLDWTAAPAAATYEVYKGDAPDLPALLDASPDSCLLLSTANLTSGPALFEDPAEGAFFWFLVRGANASGLGPAGDSSFGPRIHDPSGPCP